MYRDDLAPRIAFDRSVDLTLSDGQERSTITGRALNIGPGGMYVQSPVLLDVGTMVDVCCEFLPGQVLQAEATVTRSVIERGREPAGMALRFDEMPDVCAWGLATFIDDRLQPGKGQQVRLQIPELGNAPLKATTHGSWENMVSVDAALPFLRLGSNVNLQAPSAGDGPGQIRWVEVHVCPETGVPLLNIGIELDDSPPIAADDDAGDEAPPEIDEDRDPVCTDEYVAYARTLDTAPAFPHLRAEASA